MPKKSTPKKSKPASTSKKVNKSAFIRSQPATMSAAEVVAKGKSENISLTVNQVYTTRSNEKASKGKKASKASKGKKPAATGTGNAEQLIQKAAVWIGIEAVEAIVKKIKVEAGL